MKTKRKMSPSAFASILIEERFVLIINDGDRRIVARLPKGRTPKEALYRAAELDLVLSHALTRENKGAELQKVRSWVDGMTEEKARVTYLHEYSPTELRRSIQNDAVFALFLELGGEDLCDKGIK